MEIGHEGVEGRCVESIEVVVGRDLNDAGEYQLGGLIQNSQTCCWRMMCGLMCCFVHKQ